jgi:hypothetical protein
MIPLKHIIILLVLFIASPCLQAQDMIVFLNGDVINGKVLEVTEQTIKVKFADNLQGLDHIYETRNVRYICYDNGTRENFNGPVLEKKFELRITGSWDYSTYSKSWTERYLSGITMQRHYSYRENYYSILVTGGQRFTHYAYGLGTGAYFCDVYQNMDNESTSYDKAIDIPIYVSNKFLISESKFSPFLLLDGDVLFQNIIRIEGIKDETKIGLEMALEMLVGAGMDKNK